MIKYARIKDTLIDSLSSEFNNEELAAAVTHWLQHPDELFPYFNKQMLEASKTFLTDISFQLSLNRKLKNSKNPDFFYKIWSDIDWSELSYPPPKKWNFTFIDLFAGIGGFRQAFQNAGGKCIFTSEWDKYAKLTYQANYGETPYGDIRKINKAEIPNHDVLCAGFPCQPFSLAGVSKKNSLGTKHGFLDETQGTLFFDIKEILRVKRPKAFMLENVKNLISHDRKKTFEVIRHTLQDVLGYTIKWKIVDGKKWVPQHRERVFIVGYDPEQIRINADDIIIPEKPDPEYKYKLLSEIIHPEVEYHTIGLGTWSTLERHKAYHSARGNGFGYGIIRFPIPEEEITRTISARYQKDGAEILVEQKNNIPRRLTIQEAMQLQGYDPDRFVFPVSQTQAYKQIGNSVVIPAIQASAIEIARLLDRHHE